MFPSCKYAVLALPIRAFTSASDPPCSSMMLPKYVKVFTSSKSPSIVIELDNENFKFFEIPVPDEIDMKPTYETACQLFNNNSKSVLTNLSQSFLMDKSKWTLPILKLHTDEDETMFRRTKTLPSSKLDELFIHEVNKYKKRSEKVENISVDNFNEKYEKTLAELKNEEQKFNK
ncbi:unnamed protein product [Schistosoma curassoni]|uniref:Ribosomal protein S24/S35 mitochondrial conserved domain-containing protein n=1 Tax=Schistosoma curassoni TaxID=6186 RepID=A0A183KZU3_9TREM|nr:unnamed protein product [Schistosoma curassoni]